RKQHAVGCRACSDISAGQIRSRDLAQAARRMTLITPPSRSSQTTQPAQSLWRRKSAKPELSHC
ncbi:MAG: hypothetical protein VYE28_00730, partial [Planctomycetota bacterium]|nr:hypothetical protein [Planctomycetota bacterium]